MTGTKAGGRKTSLTIRKKYGAEFWVNLGKQGGKKSRNGGFASTKVGKDGLTGPERAKLYSGCKVKNRV